MSQTASTEESLGTERERLPRLQRGSGYLLRTILAACFALAVLAMLLVFNQRQRFENLQLQLAQQTTEAVSQSIEARTLARNATELVHDANVKLAALEGRIGDLAVYRTRLETLVQSVVQARDENLVVDLEAALRFAQDQSQLTGSPRPLVAALQTARRRLEQSVDSSLIPLSRAVEADLNRLQRSEMPNSTLLISQLGQVLGHIDRLTPLAAKAQMWQEISTPAADGPKAAVHGWWRRWRRDAGADRQEERGAVVSAVLRNQADLAQLRRENLRLRVLGARLALLARQPGAAQIDLAAARVMLQQWFDPDASPAPLAATLLTNISQQVKDSPLPMATESFRALADVAAAQDQQRLAEE